MREKLAYVETIKSLSPIPGADKIEKAEILGWELVVKKGEFQVGDKCIYIEIDSILPEYAVFEFLRPRKFRIKTVKLKNQISQGIAFPLSILKEIDPTVDLNDLTVGQDLTANLKITKYDPEAILDITLSQEAPKSWWSRKFSFLKWKLFGFKPIKKDDFPNDVPKTDEVRVQHMGNLLQKQQGTSVYITEKCEGTSGTFVFRKRGNWIAKLLKKAYIFQVCSRNRIIYSSDKKGETTHSIYQIAEKYQLLPKLQKLNRNIAIQGEVLGAKIQGNIYQLPELQLKIFSIFDIDTQQYLTYYQMMDIVDKLKLPTAPILQTDIPLQSDIKYYVALSKGKSQINSNILREGIVIRAMDSSFSFKSINPEYLLHQELKH